ARTWWGAAGTPNGGARRGRTPPARLVLDTPASAFVDSPVGTVSRKDSYARAGKDSREAGQRKGDGGADARRGCCPCGYGRRRGVRSNCTAALEVGQVRRRHARERQGPQARLHL